MRNFLWLPAIVLLVALAWTAGWFYAAGEVREAVATLGEGDGETNPKITCDDLRVTGFPFRLDVACEGATLVDGDFTTTLAGLRGSVLIYNPTHIVASAKAPMALADAFTGRQRRVDFADAEASLRLTSGDFWAGLQGEGWRIARASLIANGLRWTDTLVGETLISSAGHLEAHLIDIPEQHDAAAGLSALAAYATITDIAAPGFAIAGGETSLEAELSGVPDDLRALLEPGVMRSWRDAGGRLKLFAIKGSAGEDFFESSGEVGLDAEALLGGQLQLKSKGAVERIDDLLPPDWKHLILGAQAADGSYSQVVTINRGVIFSGMVPLGMIPPLL